MLSWKLWRALCRPPYNHPLFVRVANAHNGSSSILRTFKFTGFYLIACVLFTLAWPFILINPALVLLFAAASANTIYAMSWAARIGTAIAHEREQYTFDLICLIPVGALGAGWALSTAHLHRSALFQNLRLLMHSLTVALIGALITTIPVTLTLASGSSTSYSLFLLLDYGIAITAAFYFDHIQSVTLAYLVGMITASIAQNRINAQLWSVGVFLLLQLFVYLLTLIIGIVVLQAPLYVDDTARNAIMPLLWLAIFYALREGVIRLIWRLLAHQFNAGPSEQAGIFGEGSYD